MPQQTNQQTNKGGALASKWLKNPRKFSHAQLLVFALIFGAIGVYFLARSFAAGDTVVTINPNSVYYTLPKYWLGGKMTAYGADIVNGTYQGGIAPKTSDNKTFPQLILESGLDSVNQSMCFQGTPANPDNNWNSVRDLQRLMVKGGTVNGASYPGGAAASPHFMMGVNTAPNPTTTAPETQPSNRAPVGNQASRENIKAWIDAYVNEFGLDHIMSVEFYNEPATVNTHQLCRDSGAWYSYDVFSNADRKAADFNSDGSVNILDLSILLSNYGT